MSNLTQGLGFPIGRNYDITLSLSVLICIIYISLGVFSLLCVHQGTVCRSGRTVVGGGSLMTKILGNTSLY